MGKLVVGGGLVDGCPTHICGFQLNIYLLLIFFEDLGHFLKSGFNLTYEIAQGAATLFYEMLKHEAKLDKSSGKFFQFITNIL